MGLFWCPKQASSVANSGGSGTITAHKGCSVCVLRRFVRRLKKQGKLLRSATRPANFHCQYDPLSYSKNFDRGSSENAFDDESARFYAFSSRFVAVVPANAPTASH
ncbi:hypothetical protein QJS04_geneDACA014381 [Acorus gramineus]|uniref:Uncharacterized protein n=1 Tax=Acorus gramineus TaxID=55184 RepID=A0AAV9A153_ACOGR|nr:hypothetical protein QJS04_geneDACA014381 [Acorus gramineus]